MLFYLEAAILSAGVLIGILSLIIAWVYLRNLRTPAPADGGTATIILPLTGPAPGLEDLLGALSRQTLPPRRLLISVESETDPAYRRAKSAQGAFSFPTEVIVAGPGDRAAQKCTNQVAALRLIDADDQVIVFLDADALPPVWWLSAVVRPLMQDVADLVTGYRWQMVKHHGIGAHLVAAIDHSIALLPRFPFARAVWGGTLAMKRETLDALDIREVLSGALIDDIAIADQAARQGVRVLTRRALLIPSHMDYDLVKAWRFGRRQYQFFAISRPLLWSLAVVVSGLRLGAWVILLNALPNPMLALSAGTLLIVPAILQQLCIFRIAGKLGMSGPAAVQSIQLILATAKPLVDAFNLSMLLAAAWTRRVTWGHIQYSVSGTYDVEVARRDTWRN